MYGLLGIAIEIVWTAVYDKVFNKKPGWDLAGVTYIWMIPIYGCTVLFFEPLHSLLDSQLVVWYWRGLIYMNGIFLIEYVFGKLLEKLGKCPWDYEKETTFHFQRVIRLDYIPVWFTLGLILEHVDDLLTKMTPQVYSIF